MSIAVASGHQLTTDAAMAVLQEGGTAVDACLAAAFVSFFAEPVLSQPLGGGFLMVAPDGAPPQLLDAFIQTPRTPPVEADLDLRTITVDFGTTTQDFHIGAGTTGAPSLIQGLFDAHDRLGRIPMRELVAQAVALGRAGHRVNGFQAELARIVAPILTASDSTRSLYCEGDAVLAEGARFLNPALSDVLEVLAIEGPRLFSEGEIAQALLAMPGCALEQVDLRRAAPRWRTPLAIERRGVKAFLNPPPSLGGVQIALALSALPDAPGPVEIARCMAGINHIRREAGIDDAPESAASILRPDLVAQLRAVLSGHAPALRGTTHISVIDAQGTGAALTLSNGEGNGQVLPGTGIHPNNMLGEEDLVPGGPTAWTPDRRLASMMCPMCLRGADGAMTMLGSGGSNRIRSALTLVALDLIDHGRDLETAVHAPRLHVEGEKVDYESFGPEARSAALRDACPEAAAWPAPSVFFGGVHAVRRTRDGATTGAGDPRRSGVAATG